MKRLIKNKKGVTLIELIIASAIFTIVVSAAFPMLILSLNFSNSQFKESAYRNDVRVASARFINDIKGSTTVMSIESKRAEFNGGQIIYEINHGHLVRKEGSNVLAFENIKEVNFISHYGLVTVGFNNGQGQEVEFKVYNDMYAIIPPTSPPTSPPSNPGEQSSFFEFLLRDDIVIFASSPIRVTGPLHAKKIKGSIEYQSADIKMPSLRAESWYFSKGYLPSSNVTNGMRFFSGTSSFSTGNHKVANDVIIVTGKDVTIGNHSKLSGIIFAPDGKVTIEPNGSFEGIIIAKTVEIKGNALSGSSNYVNFKTINLSEDNIPFTAGGS